MAAVVFALENEAGVHERGENRIIGSAGHRKEDGANGISSGGRAVGW